MSKHRFHRCSFLAKAACAGGWLAGAPYVWSQPRSGKPSSNEGLGVLAIGVRGRGPVVAVGSCAFGRVNACCDVDTASRDKFLTHLAEVQTQKPAYYEDYRKALEHPGVDVITIGTSDHGHTRILLDAVRAGKDVYVEKPMALTIDDGKIAGKLIRETGRVVQTDRGRRADDTHAQFRRVRAPPLRADFRRVDPSSGDDHVPGGQYLDTHRPQDHMGSRVRGDRRRRGSKRAAPPRVPRSVGISGHLPHPVIPCSTVSLPVTISPSRRIVCRSRVEDRPTS